MRFAFDLPNFGPFADVRLLADLASEAEQAGWDGFFIWDHVAPTFVPGMHPPVADPWVALTAIAMATEHIRIGPMVTPVARRRPQKLARETVTLDRLSQGRLILGVGLGFPPEAEFTAFGDEADDRVRAERLDEGLDVLAGLWSGEPFSYSGRHHRVSETTFLPTPVQTPRIPVWVAAMWPHQAPVRRAARWDGVFPISASFGEGGWLTPNDVADLGDVVGRHRTESGTFDVVVGAPPHGDREQEAEMIRGFARAGATWWVDSADTPEEAAERIRRGPPSA